MGLAFDAETLKRLSMAQLVADSVAQAIVEDFMIFEMFPKALKYGSEITIELIKSKPIEQVGELVKGVGKMQESQGKAVQYASKGLYPWKDLL